MYTELHDNRNMWYDALNDVHHHGKPDSFGDNHIPCYNQYFYAYLSCIDEFYDED